MDGWMDGCMDAWMDGWMDGRMDGCSSNRQPLSSELRSDVDPYEIDLATYKINALVLKGRQHISDDCLTGTNPVISRGDSVPQLSTGSNTSANTFISRGVCVNTAGDPSRPLYPHRNNTNNQRLFGEHQSGFMS